MVGGDLSNVVLETAKKLGQPTVGELVDAWLSRRGLKKDNQSSLR